MARGREPGLELREDVDTVLAPGMILSMEPMLMVPEVGLSKISTYLHIYISTKIITLFWTNTGPYTDCFIQKSWRRTFAKFE